MSPTQITSLLSNNSNSVEHFIKYVKQLKQAGICFTFVLVSSWDLTQHTQSFSAENVHKQRLFNKHKGQIQCFSNINNRIAYMQRSSTLKSLFNSAFD